LAAKGVRALSQQNTEKKPKEKHLV
jgi:hypothetical protein